MGGRGSYSSTSYGMSMETDARNALRSLGVDPDAKVKPGEHSKAVRMAHAEIASWAYDNRGAGSPQIGNMSKKTREGVASLERERFAQAAKMSMSGGSWSVDPSRGITVAEAKRRNADEWRRIKNAHRLTMEYLGVL